MRMVTVPANLLIAIGILFPVAGAVGWNVGAQAFRPVVVHTEPRRFHNWDIADPWERCLAAMEAAEIPGDMWECHEPK